MTAYLTYLCASLKHNDVGSLHEKLLGGQAVWNVGKQKMLASVFLQKERIEHDQQLQRVEELSDLSTKQEVILQ